MAAALDLRGEHVGLLEVVEPVGSGGNKGVVWLCRCSCGRHCYRFAHYLKRSKRDGVECQCHECLTEYRRGSALAMREELKAIFVAAYIEGRGLYSSDASEGMRRDILTSVEKALGFFPDEPLPPLPIPHDAGWMCQPPRKRKRGSAQPEPSEHELAVQRIEAESAWSKRQTALNQERWELDDDDS